MLLPRIAAVAGVAVMAAMTTPAHASPVPTYTCDRTFAGAKHKGTGWLNCAGPQGAPSSGPITGTFQIQPRNGSGPTLQCAQQPPDYYPSGHADLPDSVTGFFCVRI
ncbi:hypothetical protein GWI34_10125 [Actinomadura sp. DSM 109109]|nr:hypothetical protein [Actinomadura lepetitiana]